MLHTRGLTTHQVLHIIRRLIEYPAAEVCRHHVAALLLSALEESNPELEHDSDFVGLCEAVCINSHGDEAALQVLNGISERRAGE